MSSINLAKKIVIWPVDRLRPYEKNARTHSDDQVEKIAASIAEFGFTNPILVDTEDGIIAGHGRLMAAKRLGLEEVPIVVLDHLSDEQRRAYIIADNKLAELAGWSEELLAHELRELQKDGFDLSLTGFDGNELDEILADATADFDLEEDTNSKELPKALQLEPPKEYAVIMCDDLEDWEELKVALNLTPVRRGGYKKGSAFDAVGTQRVVKAKRLLAMLQERGDADRDPK